MDSVLAAEEEVDVLTVDGRMQYESLGGGPEAEFGVRDRGGHDARLLHDLATKEGFGYLSMLRQSIEERLVDEVSSRINLPGLVHLQEVCSGPAPLAPIYKRCRR